MSVAGQIQEQVDLAVAAAVTPLIKGMAELTKRVAELEGRTPSAGAAPAKKAVARPATAGVKAGAKDTK